MKIRYFQASVMVAVAAVVFFTGYAVADLMMMTAGLVLTIPAGLYLMLAKNETRTPRGWDVAETDHN